MLYKVTTELSLPGLANPKFEDLSVKESEKGGRVIGGGQGDLIFNGFTLKKSIDKTVLDNPHIMTTHKNLNEDEVFVIATEILYESFVSIGLETVEHS